MLETQEAVLKELGTPLQAIKAIKGEDGHTISQEKADLVTDLMNQRYFGTY